MIKTTIPLASYKEIEQYDSCTFFVHFDATTTDDMVTCTEIGVMTEGALTYSKLVAAIITGKYNYDSQIAILANKDDGDPEHEAAWTEFQEWRATAKRLARIIVPS